MPENSSSGVPVPEIIFFEFQGKLTAPVVETIPQEGKEATWVAHPQWVYFCLVIPYCQSDKVDSLPETPYVAFYDLFKKTDKIDEYLYRRNFSVDLSKPLIAENLLAELSKSFGEYAKTNDWSWNEGDFFTKDGFFRWFGDYETPSTEQEFFFSIVLSGASEDNSKVCANALAWERKSQQHLAHMKFEEAFDQVLSPEWVKQKGRDLWIEHLRNLQ